MKIFITGITGMIGVELAQKLRADGHDVSGLSRNTSLSRFQPHQHYLGDILDKKTVLRVLDDFHPDVVFHLAAQAYNGDSWRCEDLTYITNITGTKNVLDAIVDLDINTKFIPACSSAEYGYNNGAPLKEVAPIQPISPYGVTKAATELISLQYGMSRNIYVVIPRIFITLGTGHPPSTAVQNFAKQVAEIKLGIRKDKIKVGDITTSRDFIDARDCVDALALIMEFGKPQEIFNVCTGTSHFISDVLWLLCSFAGLSNIDVYEISKELLRIADETTLVGDNSKLRSLGWKQQYKFEDTIERIYKDWIQRLK